MSTEQHYTYEHPRPRKGRLGYWWRITCMLLSRKPDEEVAAYIADGASMFCTARVYSKFGKPLFDVVPTGYAAVFKRDGAYWTEQPEVTQK